MYALDGVHAVCYIYISTLHEFGHKLSTFQFNCATDRRPRCTAGRQNQKKNYRIKYTAGIYVVQSASTNTQLNIHTYVDNIHIYIHSIHHI